MAAEECTCSRLADLRLRGECELHAHRDRPVYNNESFWWSAPMRENYIGLDRGPEPLTVSALAEARAVAAARRREVLEAQPRRPRL